MNLHLIPFVGGWRVVFTEGNGAPQVVATGFWPTAAIAAECASVKARMGRKEIASITIYPGNDESHAVAVAKNYGFTYSDNVPEVVKAAAT